MNTPIARMNTALHIARYREVFLHASNYGNFWFVQFLEEDLRTSFCGKLTYSTVDEIRELLRRFKVSVDQGENFEAGIRRAEHRDLLRHAYATAIHGPQDQISKERDLTMHKVLMSFTYRKGWHVCFFEANRDRRQLPRLAFFRSDEAMVEFTRRAGGPKTLEERNIFDMMIRRTFGEITLDLTETQYAELKQPRPAMAIPKRPSASVRDDRNEPLRHPRQGIL